MLLLILLNQPLSKSNFTGCQGVGNFLFPIGNALVIDRLGGRQLKLGNFLLGGFFNGAQHAALTRRHEQNRITLTTCSAGAAYTVYIGFGIVRNIIVNHVTDALNVESTSRHIRRNQNIERALFQSLDHFFAVFLGHIAVHGGRCVTTSFQFFCQLYGGYFGADKNQNGIETFYLENPGKCIQLVQTAHQPIPLANGFRRGGSRLNRDFLRILQMTERYALNCFRHGCREQRHLTLRRSLLQNPVDFVDETHAQHFICFIQNQRLQAIQFQSALAHVIHYPPGGTHHHMHTTPKRS